MTPKSPGSSSPVTIYILRNAGTCIVIKLFVIIFSADMGVVKSNVDVLVKEGLGERAETDFILARDTCVALLKLGVKRKVMNSICIVTVGVGDEILKILTYVMYNSFATNFLKNIFSHCHVRGIMPYETSGFPQSLKSS